LTINNPGACLTARKHDKLAEGLHDARAGPAFQFENDAPLCRINTRRALDTIKDKIINRAMRRKHRRGSLSEVSPQNHGQKAGSEEETFRPRPYDACVIVFFHLALLK
jgi:hypothetical protein